MTLVSDQGHQTNPSTLHLMQAGSVINDAPHSEIANYKNNLQTFNLDHSISNLNILLWEFIHDQGGK